MKYTKEALLELGVSFIQNTGKYPGAKQWGITTCGCSRDRVYETFGNWLSFTKELEQYIQVPQKRPIKPKPDKKVSAYLVSPPACEENSKQYYINNYFLGILDKHPIVGLLYLALSAGETNIYEYIQNKSMYNNNCISSVIKTYFTDSSRSLMNRILDSYDKKYCKQCDKVLDKELYNKNRSTEDGLQDRCKYCRYAFYKDNPEIQRNIVNERRSRTSTPLSAVYREELQKIYRNCPEGSQVDHIIPLLHYEVCGLHVPWNLQYLTIAENASKSNKFISDWLQ